ncbi:hypothetical protein [Sphingomonas echinoides]|uniref:Uncharacterized protein n=1 Tax=Sphingomonas echinoides TaxID=59803 RepID=A0ABU4PKP0_9SPHN|nr:hypothetical protein [Sphingomonas echinoides]MDX5984661.1 hypothetical protein [Sphingomonas echinoides]
MGAIIHGGGRTTSFETAVMDMADLGHSDQEIAQFLDVRLDHVRRVHAYMRDTGADRKRLTDARLGSQKLAAAVLKTGRGYQ